MDSSTSQSFTSVFIQFIKNYDSVAMVDPKTGWQLHFRDIEKLVAAYSVRLRSITDTAQTVATVAGNSIEFIVFCLAAFDCGIVVAPINPASKKSEVEKLITECGVEIVFSDADNFDKAIEEEEEPNTILLPEYGNAVLFFSSGTTGPPKGILHSHRGLIAHLEQIRMMRSGCGDHQFPLIGRADVVHGVLPFFHMGGLITVLVMLYQGATVVVNRKWDADEFLDNLRKYKVTTINIVPPVLEFLSSHPGVVELQHLRYVFVGAARCDPVLMKKVRDRLPNVELIQLFGMTEAGVFLTMTPLGNTNFSSVGVVLPGVEIEISDKSISMGEILVRSSTMMQQYLDGSISPVSEDGWFETGDLGSLDKDGFLFIEGRSKDMIKVRGWQVSPYELEHHLLSSFPSLSDVIVVGCPHDQDGHHPVAYFVGKADPEELITSIKDNFISYKHLSSAVRVDSIPRTASGKTIRKFTKSTGTL